MRVNEITKPKNWYKPKLKSTVKNVKPIKGPYAPPPKALPKPADQPLTPLQAKRNQEKIQQDYANTMINAMGRNSGNSMKANDSARSQREMEAFIKIVRGEIPR